MLPFNKWGLIRFKIIKERPRETIVYVVYFALQNVSALPFFSSGHGIKSVNGVIKNVRIFLLV